MSVYISHILICSWLVSALRERKGWEGGKEKRKERLEEGARGPPKADPNHCRTRCRERAAGPDTAKSAQVDETCAACNAGPEIVKVGARYPRTVVPKSSKCDSERCFRNEFGRAYAQMDTSGRIWAPRNLLGGLGLRERWIRGRVDFLITLLQIVKILRA